MSGAALMFAELMLDDDEDDDLSQVQGELLVRGRRGGLRRLAAHEILIDVYLDEEQDQDSLTGLRLVPGGRRLQ